MTYLMALEAELCRDLGRLDEALERTAEALAIAERKGGERWYAAELHRLRGELSLRAALAASDCEQHFRRAIEVARGQAQVV